MAFIGLIISRHRFSVRQGQAREPVDVSHQEGHRQSRLLPLLLSMVDSGHFQSHFPLTAGSLSAARWGGGRVDLESSTVTVTVGLNTPVCSRSGGGRTLRDHPAASWDTGHRGVRGHLAHAAAGHRPLSDRVHQDPQVRLQHRREETQVRSETGKQSREVAFAKFCFRH